ncbi:MAG: hypothetical protein HOO06_02330 [Bdellovibrionaceae bacterium]|jgi:putative transposase|nr:hypothetical protein [Pseudobdellovibrionaceae bacterium]
MPRKIIELSKIYPYHICARSNNKDWYDIPLALVYEIYGVVLKKTIQEYGVSCHAFILMANHYHMLISTPHNNISAAMRYFMTETSRKIARGSNRINRVYGRRYHWTIIRTSAQYAHTLKYIYLNPVRAKVCSAAENYEWSTLYYNSNHIKILVEKNRNGFEEFIPSSQAQVLTWINEQMSEYYLNNVKAALRRHEFKFPQNRKTGKRPDFNDDLHPQKMPGT